MRAAAGIVARALQHFHVVDGQRNRGDVTMAKTIIERQSEEKPGEPKDAERTEGPIARSIESQTAKIPSDLWLWSAVASMLLSLGLQLSGKRRTKQVSNFIGQWAPTLLILGLYNKLVKVAGHDRSDS
jgi:hypothetical protein